jgi:hydrogenase-1 operon protein HyaF
MSRLGEIPIRIVSRTPAASACTIGGGVTAILIEIATHLDLLADGGEPGAIDLRSLPMSPSDREQLLEALGPGEVSITLKGDGESTINETGIQGVWWSEYRDRGGELIAGFIEIAQVPSILPVEPDQLRRGAQQLRDSAASAAQLRGN